MATYVATQTVTVRNEHGQPEQLKAGVTFVHDSTHYLVRKYADLFEVVRTGKHKRPRSKPAWTI